LTDARDQSWRRSLDGHLSRQISITEAALAGKGDTLGSLKRQLAFAGGATCGLVALWILVPMALLPTAVLLAILGLLLAAVRPALVSIVFLSLTYFKLNEISPALEPLRFVLSFGSILTTFALIWHLVFTHSIRPEFNGPLTLVAVFWLFVSAGVVTAQDHTMAYQAWSEYSKTLLLALAIVWFVKTETQIRLLVRLFLIGGSIISASTIFNAWSGVQLVEGTRAAAGSGTLQNPNDLALILLLPLAFGAALLLRRERPVDRAIGAVGMLLIGYAIILTESRGGLLGILTVFAIIGGRYVRSKLLLVGIGVPLAVMLYAAMGISGRQSGGGGDAKGESAQDRIYAWHAGTNMAKVFPLTGVGIGNFVPQFSTYSPEEVQHPLTAHSIWFLVLGEIGFPGLVVFVSLVVVCIRACVKNIAKLASIRAPPDLQASALATLAALAGYLVSGSFLSYAYQWPLYVLVALTVALGRVANRHHGRAVSSAEPRTVEADRQSTVRSRL